MRFLFYCSVAALLAAVGREGEATPAYSEMATPGKISGSYGGQIGGQVLGFAVEMSPDGSTVAIASPGNDREGSPRGSTDIFTFQNGQYTNQTSLQVQGTSITFSSHADSLALCDYWGTVHTYSKINNSTWSADISSPFAKIGNSTHFCESVAIDGAGATLAVGVPTSKQRTGSVYIYRKVAPGHWNLSDTVRGNDTVGQAYFGGSIDLSSAGDRLVAGGFLDDDYTGAAWVFEYSDNRWNQMSSKLKAAAQMTFGFAVAISADGSTLVVGAPWLGSTSGGFSVFRYNVAISTWEAKLSLQAPRGVPLSARVGSSVALTADGNRILVGASGDASKRGSVYTYKFNGNTWTQDGGAIHGSGYTIEPILSSFGASVSVMGTGERMISSAPQDDDYKGAAWFFKFNPANKRPWTKQILGRCATRRNKKITRFECLTKMSECSIHGLPMKWTGYTCLRLGKTIVS